MKHLNELGAEVREALDGEVDAHTRQEQREALLDAAQRRREGAGRRPRARWAFAAAAAVLAVLGAAGALALSWPGSVDEPAGGEAVAAESRWVEAVEAPERVDIDRTSLRFGVGSRGRVEARPDRVRVSLEVGRVDAAVDRSGGRQWRFLAGPYAVEVVGTELSVDWDAESRQIEVIVTEGEVRVTGGALGEQGVAVRAGHRLRTGTRSDAVELGPIQAAEAEAAPEEAEGAVAVVPQEEVEAPAGEEPRTDEPAAADSAEARPAPNGSKGARRREDRAKPAGAHAAHAPGGDEAAPKEEVPPAPARWKPLAEAGRHREALEAAQAAGFDRLTSTLPAWDLLLLADCARLGGDRPGARRALEALRRRHPGSEASPAAAYRLGRLGGGAAVEARWFRTYLREAPSGRLAPEASGRLVQALHRGGDQEAARTAARAYLERHPAGSYAPFCRRVLGAEAP